MMLMETKYGTVALGDAWKCEGDLFADCDLEEIPPELQAHIDQIILEGKRQAFQEYQEMYGSRRYRTLEELEQDFPMELEKPYLGIHLDMDAEILKAELYVNGYDRDSRGRRLEFHHCEQLDADPEFLIRLLMSRIHRCRQRADDGQTQPL